MTQSFFQSIVQQLQQDPFLKIHCSDLREIRITMAGDILFDDAYLAQVEYVFHTPRGIYIVHDLDDLTQLIWEVEAETAIVYDYETPDFHRRLAATRRVLDNVEVPNFYDYYADNVHDYATGEIQSFTLKREDEVS